MTLYEKWIQHVNLHKPASIVCEICFKGDYKDPHYCVFMNTVKNGKSCEDFILGDLKPGSYDLTDLMETQKIVSLNDDWKDDSHFFYFMSLLVNIDTLKVAKELRFSTTNRFSTELPSKIIMDRYQIELPSRGLYRGVRMDTDSYDKYRNLGVGSEFIVSNPMLAMTELLGRGLDYSMRKRPHDKPSTDSGILIEIKNYRGLPIAALSTYPLEREWRVLGKYYVNEIVQELSPSSIGVSAEDWVLTDWPDPVEKVVNWCLIRLSAEELK